MNCYRCKVRANNALRTTFMLDEDRNRYHACEDSTVYVAALTCEEAGKIVGPKCLSVERVGLFLQDKPEVPS